MHSVAPGHHGSKVPRPRTNERPGADSGTFGDRARGSAGGQLDLVDPDVLDRAVLCRQVVDLEPAGLVGTDPVGNDDVEGAPAAGPTRGVHLLIGENLAARSQDLDAELRLEDVRLASNAAGVGERSAPRRPI